MSISIADILWQFFMEKIALEIGPNRFHSGQKLFHTICV
jgi:hypothetical protein